MKKKFVLLLFLLLPILVLTGSAGVRAQSDASDLENKIEDYQKKLDEIQGRAKTLSNEIEYMDNQMSLTEMRISSSQANISKTETKIEKLGGDINDLGKLIVKLEKSIDYQRVALGVKLRERYKTLDETPLYAFLYTDSLYHGVQKIENLRNMEQASLALLDSMKRNKDRYGTQKDLLQKKKDEQEALRKQLEDQKLALVSQRDALDAQKSQKESLLKKTNNDEKKYQQLLADAQQELNSIVGAVSVLKGQTSKKVKKGDVIGRQGNSGYSFGSHLHFGAYKYKSFEEIDGWNWYYSNYVDPAKVLEKKTLFWDTGCSASGNKSVGSGDWRWPMASPTVTQGFGKTCWSAVYYGGKVHPAFDMASSYGSPIYAVADGQAFSCRNCLGDGGNGVFIFHDDGYMTVYWHLQ